MWLSFLFTQLKPPITVFSSNLTCSALVARAIQHLSLCTQPLNEPPDLHLWGLCLKIVCKRQERCSNILHKIMVSWKLYILLSSPTFCSFTVLQIFLTSSYSSSDVTVSFKLEKKNDEEEKNPHYLTQYLRRGIELLTRMVLFLFLTTNNREPIFLFLRTQ